MKKIILILLLLLPLALADDNFYQADSLKLKLNINGGFDLIPESSIAQLKSVSTELLLFPENSFRQELLSLDTKGVISDNKILFEWTDKVIEQKTFGYEALIRTLNTRKEVDRKIAYPPTTIEGYEEYTLPTETVDSHHPAIRSKARELAAGEDDLFKVVFNLASWVEENIKYDLNSLTASASQKASWVLENKQGVCDEMSSLFIAMARSLGIPARFVSGISYTTSELFDEPWQPHGWTEIYFPEVGWVSFDIAFGEYGYVDVTHITLREGPDPAEPTTKYEWLADKVKLKTDENVQMNVEVLDIGQTVPEELVIEENFASLSVEFGSYNLVKGIIKNQADYYLATTLQLAVPKEVEIVGRDKRNLLLLPREVKETYWIVKVKDDLDQNFWYEFPTVIYSEKNVSVTDKFSVQKGSRQYSREEIEELAGVDEEKGYSKKVNFDCDLPEQIRLGEEVEFTCMIKNQGSQELKNLNFCVQEDCQTINLAPLQELSNKKMFKGENVGWNNLLVSAENDVVEKKNFFSFMVNDAPKIKIIIHSPDEVSFRETLSISTTLEKESFSIPQNITLVLQGANFENKWEMEALAEKEALNLEINEFPLKARNEFIIILRWNDEAGQSYSAEENFTILGKAQNFTDRIKMLINRIFPIFNK